MPTPESPPTPPPVSQASQQPLPPRAAATRLSTHCLHGVRAVGALLVVLAHLTGPRGFEGKVFGGPGAFDALHDATVGVGVDVFLTLSGFLLVLTAAGPRLGERSAGASLWRRLVRVLPLYWLATTGVLAIHLLLPGAVNSSQEQPPDVLASYLLLPQQGLPLLLVGWTLTHVVGFYLVFHAGLLTGSARGLWTVLGAWAAVVTAAAVAVLLAPPGAAGPWLVALGSPHNLQPLLGAALAQALLAGWRRRGGLALVTGAVLLLALTGARLLPVPGTTSGAYRLLGVTTAVLLLLYGLLALEQSHRRRTPRPLLPVAASSYSLYLVHVPLVGALAVVAGRLPLPTATPVRVGVVLLVLLACLGLARLVHRFVEQPLVAALTERLPAALARRRAPRVVDVTTAEAPARRVR